MNQFSTMEKEKLEIKKPIFKSSYSVAELHTLANNPFFSAYLNNKLFIFLMWMQKPNAKTVSEEKRQALTCFLFDLQHHFMPPALQYKYRHIYRWLKICVTKYPNVQLKHRLTAIKMCERIYQAFGLQLKFDGPGWRETVVQVIKKEMVLKDQETLRKAGAEK